MVDTLYMCVLSIDVTMHNNAYIYNMYMCVCNSHLCIPNGDYKPTNTVTQLVAPA